MKKWQVPVITLLVVGPRSVHKPTRVPVAVVFTATHAAPITAAAVLAAFDMPIMVQVQFAHQDLEHGLSF
jgi:hypothetical protein